MAKANSRTPYPVREYIYKIDESDFQLRKLLMLIVFTTVILCTSVATNSEVIFALPQLMRGTRIETNDLWDTLQPRKMFEGVDIDRVHLDRPIL